MNDDDFTSSRDRIISLNVGRKWGSWCQQSTNINAYSNVVFNLNITVYMGYYHLYMVLCSDLLLKILNEIKIFFFFALEDDEKLYCNIQISIFPEFTFKNSFIIMVALSYPKHSPNCVLILTSAGDLG
jgi:hypothetical protein